MVSGRYIVYGLVPEEHDHLNADTPEDQRVGNTWPVYGTNDREEAKHIIKVGGGTIGDTWVVCLWAKDTETGGTIGAVPEDVSAS